MPALVRQIDASQLALYEAVPSRFEIRSQLRVQALGGGLGGLSLVEEPIDPPRTKDYDASDSPDAKPTGWPRCFDVSRWGFFLTADGELPVGGAAVAIDPPGVHALESHHGVGLLWDIRVHPSRRRSGVGRALFSAAARWARASGCRQLKIETQTVNVAACRFYAAMGCELGAIHRYGYSGCPGVAHETMLLWYLDLCQYT